MERILPLSAFKIFSPLLAFLLLGCGPPERYHLKPIAPSFSLEEYESKRPDADVEDLYALGWLYLQKGRTRAAAEVFSQLVDKVPGDADAFFYLGVAQAKEQKKTESATAFLRVLELAPGLAEAHWALALLYNERGDGYEDALRRAERGLQLDAQSGYGHFVLGFIRCSRGENESAETALIKAIELDPTQAHAHYYLALIYLRRKDEVRAVAAMERTVEADPTYTEAYYSLGTLYARTGRIDDGQRMIELFQRLSRSDMEEDHYWRLLYRKNEPLSADKRAASHFNLGLVYLQRFELDGAYRQFQAAVEASPTYVEAIHNTGVVLSLKGRHKEAKARFLQAVELDSNYALAHKNLGHSYLTNGEYEVAEQSFRRALELDMGMVEALNGLSTALIQQGRIDEGRDMRAAARVAP